MTKKEVDAFVSYCTKEITLDEIKDEELKQQVYLLSENEDYVDFVARMNKMLLPNDKIANYIITAKTGQQLEDFACAEFIYAHFDSYLKGFAFNMTSLNLGIQVMIDELYKFNENGNLIQTHLTDDKIEELMKKMNNAFVYKFTKREVMKYIKNVFHLKKKVTGEGKNKKKIYYISSVIKGRSSAFANCQNLDDIKEIAMKIFFPNKQ